MQDENIGKKFGNRTAKEFKGYSKKGAEYLFVCGCGEERVIALTDLVNGRKTSCMPCVLRKQRRERMEAKGIWPKSSN